MVTIDTARNAPNNRPSADARALECRSTPAVRPRAVHPTAIVGKRSLPPAPRATAQGRAPRAYPSIRRTDRARHLPATRTSVAPGKPKSACMSHSSAPHTPSCHDCRGATGGARTAPPGEGVPHGLKPSRSAPPHHVEVARVASTSPVGRRAACAGRAGATPRSRAARTNRSAASPVSDRHLLAP
jgi:hypothetical protein